MKVLQYSCLLVLELFLLSNQSHATQSYDYEGINFIIIVYAMTTPSDFPFFLFRHVCHTLWSLFSSNWYNWSLFYEIMISTLRNEIWNFYHKSLVIAILNLTWLHILCTYENKDIIWTNTNHRYDVLVKLRYVVASFYIFLQFLSLFFLFIYNYYCFVSCH